MKNNYFFTGYPGFLATNLIQQLIHDHRQDIEHIYLLVLPNQTHQASNELIRLTTKLSIDPSYFSIITGDITKEGLAIDQDKNLTLQNTVTHVFHLAAIYDLAVPRDLAYNVNVNGTHRVNDWVQTLEKIVRYTYFSTAYVSGTREGKIYEHELAKGQTFKNHYEETKYEAELAVDALKSQIPTTIIRPGIVKGNSQTGETIKFDGLYFMLNLLDHLRFLPITPYLGEGSPEGNFVPSDYVLQATSYLSHTPVGVGKTYHLTDPNPYTMRELQQMIAEHYLGKTPKGKISLRLTKASLSFAPIRKWLHVETEALDYFNIHSSFDASQTVADLAGSGITCPDLKDTLEPMIEFYRKYKDDHQKHIKIT